MIVVLWVVKQSPAALCFPFVLMILVPIRIYLLPYAWTPTELIAVSNNLNNLKLFGKSETKSFSDAALSFPESPILFILRSYMSIFVIQSPFKLT